MTRDEKAKRLVLKVIYAGDGPAVEAALTALAKACGKKLKKLKDTRLVEIELFDEDELFQMPEFSWVRGYRLQCLGLVGEGVIPAEQLLRIIAGLDSVVFVADASEKRFLEAPVAFAELLRASGLRNWHFERMLPIAQVANTGTPRAIRAESLALQCGLPEFMPVIDVDAVDAEVAADPDSSGARGVELVLHTLVMRLFEPALVAKELLHP